VKELQNNIENHCQRLFVPGQQLSLDETLLIWAFGRIKFKVRIISKAARYGIKLYVITDAATAFVLRVVAYTGNSTYSKLKSKLVDQDQKKTVQVVCHLIELYVLGSHRTIYVDRFYTSLELVKVLHRRPELGKNMIIKLIYKEN